MLRRQIPKVEAVCGKAARTALCGGRLAIGVPTAILNSSGHEFLAFEKRMHFVREKRDKRPAGAFMRDVCG
jgi:hypothetical protein